MANKIIIAVSELVDKTATRARAKEAYCGLENRLSTITERPITVILDCSNKTAMVTGSFLDELVLRISELSTDIKVVFRLSSNQDVEKLEKVCVVRKVYCNYQIGNGTIHRTKNTKLPRTEVQEYTGAFFTV